MGYRKIPQLLIADFSRYKCFYYRNFNIVYVGRYKMSVALLHSAWHYCQRNGQVSGEEKDSNIDLPLHTNLSCSCFFSGEFTSLINTRQMHSTFGTSPTLVNHEHALQVISASSILLSYDGIDFIVEL